MKRRILLFLFLLPALLAVGCNSHDDHSHEADAEHSHADGSSRSHDDDHDHDDHGHDDDHDHDDHGHDDDHDHDEHGHDDDHAHDEHGHDDHDHEDDHGHSHDDDSWALIAWGERFEIFPEIDPLAVGASASAHTHVTRLDDFSPLTDGRVEIVLVGGAGEQVFGADEPARPGIYNVEIQPASEGVFELLFRVVTPQGSEEIRGGVVRVGSVDDPGGLQEGPGGPVSEVQGEPVSFSKEQQWQNEFDTDDVRVGAFAESLSGLGRVRPPAGGEAVLTASVDGVLRAADDWPFLGRRVRSGETILRLIPRVAANRSLPALEAEREVLQTQHDAAAGRVQRLEELLELEAVGRREVGEARTRVKLLAARLAAATRDLEAARSAREGGGGGDEIALRAPFSGKITAVTATPGATVAAGETLVRMARTDRAWVEVALSPKDARKLAEEQVSGLLLEDGENAPMRFDDARLVSIAPELSPRTGTVAALVEIASAPGLILGSTLDAQILLQASREGVVIPTTALLDDGGVDIVYVQVGGEELARRQVKVLARQGETALVEGLTPGERLVVVGGETVRRAALMESGGGGHGHVH